MMNPISIGLAMATTAALGFANGDGPGKDGDKKSPLLDNLFQDGVKISYRPGSGVTFEGGQNDYSLNIAGRIQTKWYYTMVEGVDGVSEDSSLSSFRVRRARTKFSGHVFNEDIAYYLQLEHANAVGVLDAVVGWRFVNNEDSFVTLSFGLQKFRNGLQSDVSSSALEFVERSIASRTFADERATGALLEGGLMQNENGHQLHWHAGVANHDPAGGNATAPTADNIDSEFMYVFGAAFAPEGIKAGGTERWTEGDLEHNEMFEPLFGANLAIGTAPAVNGDTSNVQSINLFAALKTGQGIAAQAEVWIREDEARFANTTADSMGWYGQASYTMPPGEGTQWGFGARLAMVEIDDPNAALQARPSLEGSAGYLAAIANAGGGAPVPGTLFGVSGEIMEATLGVNAYYHKHKLKTQLNYIFQDVDPDGGSDLTNHGLDIMFTLLF